MKHKYASLHLLIIEDHLGDYILIEEYLKEEHKKIELSRAISYKQASEFLDSKIYDAVILDLSLPDSDDPFSLVKNIVSLAGKTPVIVLTGNSNKSFGVETLSLGISDYLYKDDLNSIQLSKSLDYSIERKRIENQLIESEKKYKSLFALSPLPMWVLDRVEFKFLNVNDATVQLYGYSREEFLNMYVSDIWNKEEPEMDKVIANKKDEFFKIKVTHSKKNGDKMFLEVRSNPIVFDGIPARVSLIHNITAQVQAEEALRLSEKRYKALVQDGSDLVMILDFEGNISYASPSVKSITGLEADIFLQNNFFYIIHQDDIAMVKDCILKLQKQKRVQIPSYRIKTTQNEWKWLETIITNLSEEPAVKGIVANSRDITQYVLQERALIESLSRYDIVAKATSDTITDYDVQNDIMTFNEGIKDMFGYAVVKKTKSGKWWWEKVHPEDKDRVKERTQEVYKNNKNQLQIEYRFRCADGTYKYVLDRSYLLRDDKGNPHRMIGSMQDLTEIHNYIQTIEKHNKRLREIAWTQSHLVRAPLARIMGIIDLLQHHRNIDNAYELIEHILTSARELDFIIRKISSKAERSTLKVK